MEAESNSNERTNEVEQTVPERPDSIHRAENDTVPEEDTNNAD